MKTHFVSAILVFMTCSAHADLVVAPNDRATQIGNAQIPDAFAVPGAIQNVYGAANFSNPVLITGMAFRLDEARGGSSASAVIPRVTVRISTYSGTFDSFDRFYDNNKGADEITAYDGSVQWSTTDLFGGTPNPFDLKLLFSTPFVYDPAKGSLLINFTSEGPFNSGIWVDAHNHGDLNVGWLVAGFNPGLKESGTIVTQFDVTNVPEPDVIHLLVIGGIIAFGSVRQLRRRT